jgi:ATP-dependent exoDNAse (exonuclease V) beta subunit
MDTISDDRSWNVIGQIKKFGKTIFRDFYKEKSNRLEVLNSEKDFFDKYSATLRHERDEAKETMLHFAETFFELIEAEGLTVDDFSGKSRGVCSLFLKLKRGEFGEDIFNKTALDAAEDPAKWYAKTNQRASFIHAFAEDKLMPLLNTIIAEQPVQYKRYKSADLTLRHLSQLRLLGSIESKVHELNDNANRFLLSDTQQLLHELIKDSDSPFVFEKIGTHLEHIMIDEFQDTSTVQWQNFKILLEEAMSHEGTSNLIVGDVKQSIYRWRSGDWRLLANINGEFQNASQRLEVLPMDTNYRSTPNIIRFNNAFFTEAASQEEVAAYDDVSQKWLESKADEGRVDIQLLTGEDYQQQTLDTLVEHISDLLSQGIAPKKIAILLRSNANITVIANHLMATLPEVSVISDEAFRLDASPAVLVIIHALRSLTHPDDMITRAFLQKAYSGKIDGALPEDFDTSLLLLPLYDLVERLYSIFSLQEMKDQSAYLCTFYDHVLNYIGEKSTDVNGFLREWDATLCSKTIQCSDVDGIRILSIHKSKGLEFDHVLIPFCDWRMEMPDVLWCEPKENPYMALPLAAIDYSQKGMKGTIYEDDYNTEHLQNVVDNLNLLYVAFTRAVESLFVIGKRQGKGSRSERIEQVLPVIDLEGAEISGLDNETQPILFSYGHLPHHNSQLSIINSQLSYNPFTQPSTIIPVEIETFSLKTSFRQSNQSKDFVNAEDEEFTQQSNYIKMGNILHNVFAHIRTTQNIDSALQQMEMEGIIYDAQLTREKIEAMIHKRLSDKRVAQWFSTEWSLYNECTILLPNGEERRPDRVMTNGNKTVVIDFKFGHPREEYHEQVREYMDLLRQMGLQNVTGYLWFVYSNQIIEVK